MKMRRNSVVYCKRDDNYSFYGRIVSMRGSYAEVIDCGKYLRILPVSELVHVIDYKGTVAAYGPWASRNEEGHELFRVRRMTTLRKLKQMRQGYSYYGDFFHIDSFVKMFQIGKKEHELHDLSRLNKKHVLYKKRKYFDFVLDADFQDLEDAEGNDFMYGEEVFLDHRKCILLQKEEVALISLIY